MDNNLGKGFIEELAKELRSSLNMKNLTPEQQSEIAKGMGEIGKIFELDGDLLKNLMGGDKDAKMFDLNDISKFFTKDSDTNKKDDVKAKSVETDPSFLKRTHGENNIDMDAEVSSDKESNRVEKKVDILNDVIRKIVGKQLSIADLTKEVLDVLVNDERTTDDTVDAVCKQCNIDRAVFEHLCKIYEVKAKEKVMEIYPVDIKSISESDDLSYFINSYALILTQNFKDVEFKNRLLINIVESVTLELELNGIGTSASQTAFPCQMRNEHGDIITGFALFNIPLESFIDNFGSITLKPDKDGCPVFLIKK